MMQPQQQRASGVGAAIRPCDDRDFAAIWEIINDGAQKYKGVIPRDCWTEPYMSREKLQHEIADGVVFSGWEEDGTLLGVMGIQPVQDVTLIRHAYVRTTNQNQGIGGRLLRHLREQANNAAKNSASSSPVGSVRPVLIGTWAAASWAINFYQRHGFQLIAPVQEKDRLLKKYWKIPDRQMETSVVLADAEWRKRAQLSVAQQQM